MRGLKVILDKSAVYGLNNDEIDSLDRYFFQIVPSILVDEIRADLTKATDNGKAIERIAANTYRISGNHGLTLSYRTRLLNSLFGTEVPMDGRFLPSREKLVRTSRGSYAIIVETPLEDEILARWQRREFSDDERAAAAAFRGKMQRPLDPKLYLDNIAAAGLSFEVPQSDHELFSSVAVLLADRQFLPRLFAILFHGFGVNSATLRQVTSRWHAEGRPSFEQFAPYAFYCLRASFLWHLRLLNPQIFPSDKNDRKDLEYAYYLPNTDILVSKDAKQLQLMAGLARPDQSLVNANTLKKDLRRIDEDWNQLSREEKIGLNAERATAPPDRADSLVFQLWRKHDGEIKPSMHTGLIGRKAVDTNLPVEERVPFTMSEFAKKRYDEVQAGRELSILEIDELRNQYNGADPSTMMLFNSKVSRTRIVKWHPELSELEVDQWKSDVQNMLWMDPSEYEGVMFIE